MGAPAQLGGKIADADDADAIAVLLSEQRHGSALEGGLQIHLGRGDHDIRLHVLVDEVLDLRHLAVLHGGAVGEVEAQMIRSDQGTRLGHVGAENPPQRGVEQMGARMVELEPLAPPRLDGDGHLLVFSQGALDHSHAVDDHLAAAVVGVLDGSLPVAPDDGAGVAHLAARLRVGRRAIEDDLDGLAQARLGAAADPPPPGRESGRAWPSACTRGIAAWAAARRAGDRSRPSRRPRPRRRKTRPRAPVALRLHLRLELLHGLGGYRPALVLEDFLGEIGREPVRVVEREEKLAVDDLDALTGTSRP